MKQSIGRVIITFISLCLFVIISKAQADTSSIIREKVSYRIGLFAINHLHYYGRTDSLRSGGVFPIVELLLDKHLYVSAAPIFIYNSETRIDYSGTVTTAGYMFRNKRWAGNAYAVIPLYKSNSQLVQSALKFQVAAIFSRITKLININLGGDIKYSDQIDFGLTAGLDHHFKCELGKDWILILDPSAYLNAGTQQFTKTSYKQNGFLLFPGVQQQVNEEVEKVNVLSYEFSIPLILAKGKARMILNPGYIIPQNLIVVAGRPDLSERGAPMFNVTAGVKFSL